MADLRNARYAIDDAITKAKRIEREAQALEQPGLAQKIKRLRRELEELQYEIERVARELG